MRPDLTTHHHLASHQELHATCANTLDSLVCLRQRQQRFQHATGCDFSDSNIITKTGAHCGAIANRQRLQPGILLEHGQQRLGAQARQPVSHFLACGCILLGLLGHPASNQASFCLPSSTHGVTPNVTRFLQQLALVVLSQQAAVTLLAFGEGGGRGGFFRRGGVGGLHLKLWLTLHWASCCCYKT